MAVKHLFFGRVLLKLSDEVHEHHYFADGVCDTEQEFRDKLRANALLEYPGGRVLDVFSRQVDDADVVKLAEEMGLMR